MPAHRNLRISCITWNVGGSGGVSSATVNLLRESALVSDVLVVGLQEVALGRRGWKKSLRSALSTDWEFLGGQNYGGMRIKVFAKSEIRPPLRLRAGMRVGVGVADRWPNKGAVAIELLYGFSCRICFVVAHLAANEKQICERQDDWVTILRRLDNTEPLTARTKDAVAPIPLFHRYDHVFFFGDLNYRLTPPGATHNARLRWVASKIDAQDWSSLSSVDQLLQERAKGNVFVNFEEAPISFAPTFKMEPYKDEYSPLRIPSYCDRILWYSLPSRRSMVKCLEYRSLPQFKCSDHRPVCAHFEVTAPIIRIPRLILTPAPSGLRVTIEFKLIRIHNTRPLEDTNRQSPMISGQSRNFESPTEGHTNLMESRPPFLPYSDSPGEEVFPENMLTRSTSLPPRKMLGFDPDDPDDDDDDDGLDCGLVHNEIVEDCTDVEGCEERPISPTLKLMGKDSEESADSSDDPTHRPRRNRISRFRHRAPDVRSHSRGLPWSHGFSITPPKHSDGAFGGPRRLNEPGLQTSLIEPELSGQGMTADVDVGPRKRHSLSEQVSAPQVRRAKDKRPFLRGVRMEVHGRGLFLKSSRVYRVGIPKFGSGRRERIGESLPVIPLVPVVDLEDLRYEHILLVFGRSGSRVGHSGVLPIADLIGEVNKPYAFDLDLTKYGAPGRRIEAVVQMTVSEGPLWVDSRGRVVRNSDMSSAKNYKGPLEIRGRTKAKTVSAYSPRS